VDSSTITQVIKRLTVNFYIPSQCVNFNQTGFSYTHHNYVIGRNECLVSTLSESTNPWVYSLKFLFKSTRHSWRYERKCECLASHDHLWQINFLLIRSQLAGSSIQGLLLLLLALLLQLLLLLLLLRCEDQNTCHVSSNPFILLK